MKPATVKKTRRKKAEENINALGSEQSNRVATEIDRKSSLQIARIINAQDTKVAFAVRRALPEVAKAIDYAAEALRKGGRIIYVGAGTSGRIAALDAAECPPTFSIPPKSIQFLIAGGDAALARAVEASEDDAGRGAEQMAQRKPGRNDVVVGIAASGRTPFTVAAVERARKMGAKTVAVTCNRNSRLEKAADLAIVTEVGAEVVAGSSRMKAGTAQKMVLNMISTGAMVRLGYVYGNLMINVHLKNAKLRERGIGVLQRAAGVTRKGAIKAIDASGKNLPVALVMLETGVNRKGAEHALGLAERNVRKAILLAGKRRSL